MAGDLQYNKTAMHALAKALKVRENALPTLQTKEAALRFEVKRSRQEARELEEKYQARREALAATYRLWGEFPESLVAVDSVSTGLRKVAGLNVPVLDAVRFREEPYSMVSAAAWVPAGVSILKEMITLTISRDLAARRTQLLEYARRKTTQKVNLYEKVQIPAYREDIRRIKRFLEDEENLSKSSQKILKARMAAAEAMA